MNTKKHNGMESCLNDNHDTDKLLNDDREDDELLNGDHGDDSRLHNGYDDDLTIKNDIFGLTIHQFEREFRSCLQRRMKHDQSILNIRFPDKTSNEYLEYLANREFKSEEHRSKFCVIEKCCYQRLQKIVGTEKTVRLRQRLFKLNDFVDKYAGLSTTKLSSGSLSEGLDLPGSDIDIMFIVHNVDIVQDVKDVYRPGHAIFQMEKCNKYPGFAKLKLLTKHKDCVSFIVQTKTGIYFSSQRFMQFLRGTKHYGQIHGPCLSDPYQHEDIAFCLRSRDWPYEAQNWIYRQRRWQWPSGGLVESITRYGILLVQIGPKYNENDELWWRLSFSVAEKIYAIHLITRSFCVMHF